MKFKYDQPKDTYVNNFIALIVIYLYKFFFYPNITQKHPVYNVGSRNGYPRVPTLVPPAQKTFLAAPE